MREDTELNETKPENIAASKSTEKYKTYKCKVLHYDKKTKILDLDFKGYGIRLSGINNANSDFYLLKYRGEIGKPDFFCKG